MFDQNLNKTVEYFARLLFPLSEKDLERTWKWKDHDGEGIRFSFFVTIQELRQLAVQLSSQRAPLTSAQKILSQYHAQYMDLQAAIFGLSADDSERIPSEGEWAVRKVYAHILGADINFSTVVRYALEKHRANQWTPDPISDEDEIRIIGMSEEEFHKLMRGPLDGMLAYHGEFHPKIIQEFSSISNEELDLPAAFWEETRFPIRHRLHRYEAHIIQHTVQIDKTLSAIGLPPAEPQRLIRYLYAALADAENQMIGQAKPDPIIEAVANSILERTIEISRLL